MISINTGRSRVVATDEVNMVNAVKLPLFISPVKDEKIRTRKPTATDAALKTMDGKSFNSQITHYEQL